MFRVKPNIVSIEAKHLPQDVMRVKACEMDGCAKRYFPNRFWKTENELVIRIKNCELFRR